MPWKCSRCTYENLNETFLTCEMCFTPRSTKTTSRSKKRSREDSSTKQTKKKRYRDVYELGTDDTDESSDDDEVVVLEKKNNTTEKPWKLIRFNGLPKDGPGNEDTLTMQDIINVPLKKVRYAVLATFDLNFDWLLNVWPELKTLQRVVLIHGCDNNSHIYMKDKAPSNFEIISRRPQNLTFGVHPRSGKDVIFPRGSHHSKFMMLGYEGGMRFVVHTAALGPSFSTCTQGAYVQDFPTKKKTSSFSSGKFESTLIEYLESYENVGRDYYSPITVSSWPGFDCDKMMKLSELVAKYDFSNARAHLLASVPGYHTGIDRDKWGHLQVRHLLARGGAVFPSRSSSMGRDVIVAQFTSFASIKDKKYRDQLKSSFSAGLRLGNTPMGPADLEFLWPTCHEVLNSAYGAVAGSVIPGTVLFFFFSFLLFYSLTQLHTHSHTHACIHTYKHQEISRTVKLF